MSTFLELGQQLHQEVDLAGEGPTTLQSVTGENRDTANWTIRACRDIDNRHLWRYLRRTATLTLTASVDTYAYSTFTDTTDAAAISRFKKWHLEDRRDPPKIYTTSSGVGNERWLTYIPWESFKTIYKIGTQNDGPPAHITRDPNDQIVVGPSPDVAYTLTIDYNMSAQTLSADADVPEMPAHFHDLIVYRAMMKYGMQQSAPEIVAWAQTESRRVMRKLENEQLPKIRKAGPMA